jgi:hypothetical protein
MILLTYRVSTVRAGALIQINTVTCLASLNLEFFAALELKQVFEQIAEAEKSGASPEEKKKLEEQAAEKVYWVARLMQLSFSHLFQGLQALFKGTKLEIDSVIRETCDRVLSPPPPSKLSANTHALSRDKLALRAQALEVLGHAYLAVRKDGDGANADSEYVRVDTKASKEREARRQSNGL